MHIPAYKNLVDVWLPWSSGLVLVGMNGAGKTNVLEALALLMGTEETLRLGQNRLAEERAEGLSVVVEGDVNGLPVGPANLIDKDLTDFGDPVEQLRRDLSWWRTEGVRIGDTFMDAVGSWNLPDVVKRHCLEAARSPILRYTLVGLRHQVPGDPYWSCEDCDPDGEPGLVEGGRCEICGGVAEQHTTVKVKQERLYRRTLLTDQALELDTRPPVSPAFHALGSPDVGAPGLKVLLELPLTTRPPAVLQWLPRSRTDNEVLQSLETAFEAALGPTEDLLDLLAERMPSDLAPIPGDGHWWLHKLGEAAANRELRRTAPSLFVESGGGRPADWSLLVDQGEGQRVHVGHTHDKPLENFSAGQRRWMDEALATISRELRLRAQRAELFTFVLNDVDDPTLLEHLVAGTEIAETEGFWDETALDTTFMSLEPMLVSIASSRDAEAPATRALVRAVLPFFAQLDEQLVIRAFDEPEAHLHVTAQRRVAAAVQSMRNEGQNILLASHATAFLEFADWQTVHLSAGALMTVTPMDVEARRRVTRELGLTHGELLSGVAGILVVEGFHDQMVLDSLYGPDLRQAGVAVIRMEGTDNLPALLNLDFVERYVDAPITVMLDYTSTERVEAGKFRTDEERKLVDLMRAARRRHLPFKTIGLRLPDIVCYLNEEAIREKCPGFPGWRPVSQKFERISHRPSFKPYLLRDFGVDLTTPDRIQEVLDLMVSKGLPPRPELHQKVTELLSAATSALVDLAPLQQK